MSRLQAGDWVEVRSKEEILATLDRNGRLEGLPFMPQMFHYCGRRFRVYQRAHKTCDTIASGRSLKVPGGIHLDLRCDGKSYGGCQAACLIFWKDAWLKLVKSHAVPTETPRGTGCSEADVDRTTRADARKPGEVPRYSCQATELLKFTTPLPWWDARQYVEDYTSKNASFDRMLRGFIYLVYFYGTLAKSARFGGPARWLYDRFQALWGGLPYPRHGGVLPVGQPEPIANLDLQPGDLVRIKPYNEILQTLNTNNKNRGMHFDGEMVPYCGRILRVRGRVEKFIDEKTGHLMRMKTPAVILDGAVCRSRYSNHRMFCPRAIYTWWREIWLERIPDNVQDHIFNASASAQRRLPSGAADRERQDVVAE
jgi:hypothetical protein